jgi:transposase
MLNVESRFMIRNMYRNGVTISDIARRTGHDRKTVRATLKGSADPPPKKRKAKPKKIDPFIAYLEKRMAEGVFNCRKLLVEIQRQGYDGSSSRLRDFVHPYREARRQEATVRFETEPGEQAQVDWAHFGFIEHHGRRRKLYAFVMTLGWSRSSYVEFTVSANAAWWLRCQLHAFHYFGGVPRVVLHDNLKTAVLERVEGTVRWNRHYLNFADYYGFTPHACRPYRAQTKGKVESGIRYMRGNFWPGLKFVDLADLNRQCQEWLDSTANRRVHGTTGEVPFDRLPEEHLLPLDGKPDYDTSLTVFRRATKDCFVSYDGNYYSVPSDYARKNVRVKETEDGQLVVLDTEGDEIARHRLVEGRNLRVAVAAHYAHLRCGSRPARRRGAIQLPTSQELVEMPPAPEVETRPLVWYDQLVEVTS